MVRPSIAILVFLLVSACPYAAVAQGVPPVRQREHWCPEPEAAQFDFWLGEWDVQNHNRPPNGDRWFETGVATNRVYTVLGGCAVVEHWRGAAFPAAGQIVGFSVRAWEPAEKRWQAVLLWPISPPASFGAPSGQAEGDELVLYNEFQAPDGSAVRSRLQFHDIEDDAFVWSNGVSRDGGRTWNASWRMEATRRPASAPGLWNGPSMTTGRCPGKEHRAFDRFLGEWSGPRVDAAGDTTAIRSWLVRILEGCAVMERTWSEDGTWESFAVRAYDEGLGRWVDYSIASNRRALRRREGDPGVGESALADVEPVTGRYTRSRWSSEDGDLRLTDEEADDPGGPWRRTAETRLEPSGG